MYDWGVHFISDSVDFLASFSFQRTEMYLGSRKWNLLKRCTEEQKRDRKTPLRLHSQTSKKTAGYLGMHSNSGVSTELRRASCMICQLPCSLSMCCHHYSVLVPIVTAFLLSPFNTFTVLVLEASSSGFLMASVPLRLSALALSFLIN